MQAGIADRADGRGVLVTDPRGSRRQQLARRAGLPIAMEAASLCEAFPIAEQTMPGVLALAADFLAEPELEGFLRLADMLGSRAFIYSADGPPPLRAGLCSHLPCIPLQPGDDVCDLIARLGDPGMHLSMAAEGAPPGLILIGASTGGIAAVEAVLSAFPADCPPTLVVQHMRDGYIRGLVRRLDARCRPHVVAAEEGARLARGMVYFAADPSRHLTIGGRASPRCALVEGPPRHGHRPSVDALFESALPMAAHVAAALLTGMGQDGAPALGDLRRAGAHTIAQDRATSVVWGMPRAAVESGSAEEVLPLPRIGAALLGPLRSTLSLRGGR